ncbi:hypothetical protein F5884DRAFT_767660 [Xylogone sp. PMI_703]|nr:hypothetical protein F5884DRAFT_767660 [Xylogone sp. PMI_703]
MAKGGGFALKTLQWLIRCLIFLCSILILGIFAYFITRLNHHGRGLHVPLWTRAVEGISGAAALYSLIGLLLLCFLAGMALFSSIAIILDILFIGAFIYLAWEFRRGRSCTGYVQTPFGSGNVNQNNRPSEYNGLPSLRTACRLEKACFAVSIVAIGLFLLALLTELLLIRRRRRERAFGPSPANNYTSGRRPRRSLWQRLTGRRAAAGAAAGAFAAEKNPDSLPAHTTPSDVRQSYNSEATAVNEPNTYGSTTHKMVNDDNPSYQKYGRPSTPRNHPAYATTTGAGMGTGVGTGTAGQTTGHTGTTTKAGLAAAAGAGAGYAGHDYATRGHGHEDTGYGYNQKSYAPGSGRVTPGSDYTPHRPTQGQHGAQEYGVTGGNDLEGGHTGSYNQTGSYGNQPLYYSATANDAVSPVAEMDTGRRY